MKIDPHLAGTRLKPHETDVNWRWTTNFAAAVSDKNPVYFDDTRDAGIVSHPMFPVAVTWPVLSRLETFLLSDTFPAEVLLTQVHYTEHLVLHRLVRPGDRLHITGKLLALLPHRAGTHAVIRLHAADRDGSPVFTEYTGAMLRGVDCGEGLICEALPRVPEKDGGPETLWTSEIRIDPLLPYLYDGCTHIEFAIHTSPKFARMVGLPGIILQGTATLALAIREIVDREADGNPERVREIACRFSGMVIPGTAIQVRCTGQKRNEDAIDIFFEVLNGEQEQVIRNGYVKLSGKGDI